MYVEKNLITGVPHNSNDSYMILLKYRRDNMDDGIWRIILGDPLEVLQYHTIWNLISLNQQISSIARLEAVLRLFLMAGLDLLKDHFGWSFRKICYVWSRYNSPANPSIYSLPRKGQICLALTSNLAWMEALEHAHFSYVQQERVVMPKGVDSIVCLGSYIVVFVELYFCR